MAQVVPTRRAGRVVFGQTVKQVVGFRFGHLGEQPDEGGSGVVVYMRVSFHLLDRTLRACLDENQLGFCSCCQHGQSLYSEQFSFRGSELDIR